MPRQQSKLSLDTVPARRRISSSQSESFASSGDETWGQSASEIPSVVVTEILRGGQSSPGTQLLGVVVRHGQPSKHIHILRQGLSEAKRKQDGKSMGTGMSLLNVGQPTRCRLSTRPIKQRAG
jgi:hypothetical protein